jgi:hypothetical protein
MQTLIDASKEVGLEINVEKTKYMLVSRDQNAGQNQEIKIGNRSFENVSQFKYLETAVTNQNLIQEEIKRRLNSGNSCYHSVQNVYKLLVGKPEGKRPLGRLRHRWTDNIKTDVLEIGLSVADWIGLVQGRYRWRALVNMVMNLLAP